MTNYQTVLPQQPNRPDEVHLASSPARTDTVYPYNQYPDAYPQYVQGQQYAPMDPAVCVRVVQTDYMMMSKHPLNGCNCALLPQSLLTDQSAKPTVVRSFKTLLTVGSLMVLGTGLFFGSRFLLDHPVEEIPAKIANFSLIETAKHHESTANNKSKKSRSHYRGGNSSNHGSPPLSTKSKSYRSMLVPPPPPFIPSGAALAMPSGAAFAMPPEPVAPPPPPAAVPADISKIGLEVSDHAKVATPSVAHVQRDSKHDSTNESSPRGNADETKRDEQPKPPTVKPAASASSSANSRSEQPAAVQPWVSPAATELPAPALYPAPQVPFYQGPRMVISGNRKRVMIDR